MESENKEQMIEKVLTLADNLFRHLLPTVPKDLLTLDITMPQMKIMLILYFNGSVRMSDIAANLDVTLPTATSLVERLVEKSYVNRFNQIDDRRVVLCRLSETGNNAVRHIWESAGQNCRQLLQAVETDKIRLLSEGLEAMLQIPVDHN